MNIVKSGDNYQIYGNSVETFKKLPVGTFDVNFHKMMGFYLSERNNLFANEEKIYGNTIKKTEKVLKSFELSNRNFGLILSGEKGIGKSLFVRILSEKAINKSLPVLICNHYYPGIADFLSEIDQEIVVIFDEFEKTFCETDCGDPQEEMLSLFDGMDNGKKLFVITCNEIRDLNEYLLNRPGRFHYHIIINQPGAEEIREYLKDKLDEKYWFNIEKIVKFSFGVKITYDILRALSFDLNQGYNLAETLEDLNIQNTQPIRFKIKLTDQNGIVYLNNTESISIKPFSNDFSYIWVQSEKNRDNFAFRIGIKGSDIEIINDCFFIDPDKIDIHYNEYEYNKEDSIRLKNLKFKNIELEKEITFNYKFNI